MGFSGANPRRLIAELQTVPELINYHDKAEVEALLLPKLESNDFMTVGGRSVVGSGNIEVTPSIAQVGRATAGLAVYAVGMFTIARYLSLSDFSIGGVTSGGNLRYYDRSYDGHYSIGASGSWRCVGASVRQYGRASGDMLWLRIA